MRNRMVIAAVVALVAGGLLAAVPASAGSDGKVREYVVLYADGASAAEARAAIESLGGTVVDEIAQIGPAKVRTTQRRLRVRSLGRGGARRGRAQPDRRVRRTGAPGEGRRGRVARRGERRRGRRRGRGRCGAARRPPVGHGDDRCHRRRVVRRRDREPRRAGRDHRHRDRRVASRPGAELQRRAQPELHHRHPADRRAVQPGA